MLTPAVNKRALAQTLASVTIGCTPDGQPRCVNGRTANELRSDLQQEATECFLANRRLILQWGTGIGKSRVAVKAVQALYLTGHRRILLLVAETQHKRNWEEQFVEHFGKAWGQTLYDSLIVECYHSLSKYAGTEWDCIIADEAHHLRSENRVEVLRSMKADYVLCVSATVSDNGDADNLLDALGKTFGSFETRDFSVGDGIRCGIIGEPKVFVHTLAIDDIRDEQYFVYGWGRPDKRVEISCPYSEFIQMKDGLITRPAAASVTVSCTAMEGYEFLSGEIADCRERIRKLKENLKEGDASSRAIQYLETEAKMYGSQRKLFIGRCKTSCAQKLLASLEGKRFICFCADVAQAEHLGAQTVISSHKSRKANADIISLFNDGRSSSVFAVSMSEEGTNLHGIEAGVIIQLGSKERKFIQRFGRALRAESPVQHILVLDETRDVEYLVDSLRNVDQKYISIVKQ